LRIVLDTNILVSALLRPDGPPGRVWDFVLSGGARPVFDDRILQEYRAVLARPKFGFEPEDVAIVLETIEAEGLGVASRPLPIVLSDPGDQPFLEVAVAGWADALVTGNLRDFPAAARRLAPVMSPGAFLRMLRKS
jgi:putative PIN family toxin of toxin-antitoxin system